MKVAICGLWPDTRHLIPFGDPEWETWGMAWDRDVLSMDRAFEMHDNAMWAQYAPKDYVEKLNLMPRLYLQQANPEVPNGVVYPFDEVAETTGDYWVSSIGYMLALAIHEGAEEIAIYGVTMKAGEEYGYQRPNAEFLIGLARGKGTKVHLPDQCSLCKYQGDLGYPARYGHMKE